MSHSIADLLIKEEGFRKHAYKDSLGYLTIGIGRLIDKRKGGGISYDEALFLLHNDIDDKEEELDQRLPWWRDLSENRQTVLLAMAFQMGVGGLLKFKRTLRAMRSGNWAEAGVRMRRSLWYRQTTSRAERMARVIETGNWRTS
jgi:lysozyme